MEIKRLEGAVEAILFAMGESVELGQIAKAIQQDKPTTEKLLHNLMDKYKDEGRGCHLYTSGNWLSDCIWESRYIVE